MSRWSGGVRLRDYREHERLLPRGHIPGEPAVSEKPLEPGVLDLGLRRVSFIRCDTWHLSFRCRCIGLVEAGETPFITLPCWEHDMGRVR